MKKVTSKHWPWAVTLFLTMLFWLHTCNLNHKLDRAEEQVTQLNLDNQTQRETINRQGRTITLQDVVITRNQASLSSLADSIFQLRQRDAHNLETIAYYKGVTKLTIKDKLIPYLDTTTMHRFEDSVLTSSQALLTYIQDSTVKIGTPAALGTPHYDLGVTIRKSGVNLDSLVVPDSLYLRFAEKSGFLRRSTIEVQYFHTNPYIKSISSQSAFYKPRKPFWKIALPVAIGLGAGILISK